jgi:hypothetical protein
MRLIALELSDVGIMVAAKEPLGLLPLEGEDRESPGLALSDEAQLLVGREAERRARLHPLQVNSAFWDQLNTEPLKQPTQHARNHADMAYAHLAHIWKRIRGRKDEMVMAVPAFLARDQLGLILGITEALNIPLKGMVSLSVAAASKPCPDRLLLHLDIHLHRSEVTFLEQGERLAQKDVATARKKGLRHLYSEWVKAIAEAFVRTTRFDPLHEASTEQEIYDRLPDVMAGLEQNPSVLFEMVMGSKTYHVNLSRELFSAKAKGVFQEIGEMIDLMRKRHGKPGQPVTLQITHRLAPLPGFREMLATIDNAQERELEPGVGAFGALDLWQEFSSPGVGVTLLTSRSWKSREAPAMTERLSVTPISHGEDTSPTHLLYRTVAYLLSDRPLVIGTGGTQDGIDVRIEGELAGVSRRHCSIQRRGAEVILTDHSTYGTFVDGEQVTGTALLRLGQVIRVGTPGEELQLITSLESDEK